MDLKEFGLFFAKLREKSGYESQRQLSIASGVSNGTIARIESGIQKVSPETLKKIAPHLKGTSYEELMHAAGYLHQENESKYSSLNEKDEKDIAKRMEEIKKDIEHADGLCFSGEPMSEEAKDSLMEAMEFIIRQTKKINKKYTPKKYRDGEKDK